VTQHQTRQGDAAADRLLALYRLEEAAKVLSISPRTLWELTRRGAVECVRCGRSVRYSRAALEAFISRGGSR
jgi:excisionase family DNA binding protein